MTDTDARLIAERDVEDAGCLRAAAVVFAVCVIIVAVLLLNAPVPLGGGW